MDGNRHHDSRHRCDMLFCYPGIGFLFCRPIVYLLIYCSLYYQRSALLFLRAAGNLPQPYPRKRTTHQTCEEVKAPPPQRGAVNCGPTINRGPTEHELPTQAENRSHPLAIIGRGIALQVSLEGGLLDSGGHCGIDMDSIADIFERQVMLQRERQFAQHFTGTRTDHVRTDELVLFACEHQFDEANSLVLGLRAVDLAPGEFHDTHLFILLLCLAGRQADASRLRIGEGTPGHNTIIDLLLADRHQRVAYSYPGLVRRDMGEEIAIYDITHGQQDFMRFNVEELIALPGNDYLFISIVTGPHEACAGIDVDPFIRQDRGNGGRDLRVFFR